MLDLEYLCIYNVNTENPNSDSSIYMLVPKIMEGLITGGAISTIKLEGQVPTSLDLDYK